MDNSYYGLWTPDPFLYFQEVPGIAGEFVIGN